MAASTSRVRRAYRGRSWLRNSAVVPSSWRTRPRGTCSSRRPSLVVIRRSRAPCRYPCRRSVRSWRPDPSAVMSSASSTVSMASRTCRRSWTSKSCRNCKTDGWLVSLVLLSCMACLHSPLITAICFSQQGGYAIFFFHKTRDTSPIAAPRKIPTPTHRRIAARCGWSASRLGSIRW